MPKFFNVDESRKVNKVYVTGSVANDFKKTREFYRANKDAIVKAFDIAMSQMNVKDKNLKLFIRNIRKAQGFYKNGANECAIDVRSYDLKSIVSTIIHELQHSIQYANGDLKVSEVKKMMKWKGENVRKYKSSENFEEYQKLPWEIEARKAETKYLDKVMKELEQA